MAELLFKARSLGFTRPPPNYSIELHKFSALTPPSASWGVTDTLLSQRHEGVSDTISGDPSPEAAVGGEGAQAGRASDSIRLTEPCDGAWPQAPHLWNGATTPTS